MNAIERWLEKESNLYLLACGVYVAIGTGYLFTPHKDILDIVSQLGCFVVSLCFFLVGSGRIGKKNEKRVC